MFLCYTCLDIRDLFLRLSTHSTKRKKERNREIQRYGEKEEETRRKRRKKGKQRREREGGRDRVTNRAL